MADNLIGGMQKQPNALQGSPGAKATGTPNSQGGNFNGGMPSFSATAGRAMQPMGQMPVAAGQPTPINQGIQDGYQAPGQDAVGTAPGANYTTPDQHQANMDMGSGLSAQQPPQGSGLSAGSVGKPLTSLLDGIEGHTLAQPGVQADNGMGLIKRAMY